MSTKKRRAGFVANTRSRRKSRIRRLKGGYTQKNIIGNGLERKKRNKSSRR